MVAQFERAPLASPPTPAFVTGDVVARPLLWAPHNVRSDGLPRRSLAGARVLSLSSVRRRAPIVMAEDAADAAFIFAAARGNFSEILTVGNGAPPPGGAGHDQHQD